jgi:preprotein translocase subunit SecA
MFDFLIRNFVVKGTQKSIEKLTPQVAVHVPRDLPLPSVQIIKRMSAAVSRINGMEETLSRLSDVELKQKTLDFRQRYYAVIREKKSAYLMLHEAYRKATSGDQREELGLSMSKIAEELKKLKQDALHEILPEVFAVVREAGKRVLGMRHYDIQLIGGMVLHEGKIAEMATGEGKTLVATLPAYLNGITGDGVHVVTVNDYLARRDREWMGPLYEFLGLTVGVILHDMSPSQRKAAYACDITYGTNNEFGFDYLRDNMVNFKEEMVQRSHVYAIVDEVDSILIDEARTPLIISGPAEESTDKYYRANDIVKRLNGRRITENEQIEAKYRNEDLSAGYDYVADEKSRSISLAETGEEKAARMFGVSNLHDMETVEYRHHILQGLKAKEFFKRDVDYVVRDGQVIIVDEFTGRLMPGRRWSDGLHQAVEAKEGIKIERENQTLASVTFQNYFRMYDKLAGMTGTAHTEAMEFSQIYNLECVVIPPNRVLQRKNHSDCVYRTVKEKNQAVVEEIAEYYHRGQPVLVGTISIEKSEVLSAMLKQRGIPHQVLNAKYHELEAQIVAQAGRFKAITIATNMAGRGTDIVLGGNADFLARSLASQKAEEKDDEAQREAMIQKFLLQFKEEVKKEHEQVVAAGGLHVIGTERHESRRIDNQLRGRSGRQGDPGSSRFFVSLEDDLIRLFASDKMLAIMDKLGMEEGEVIEHPWVSRAIEMAQKRVETHNFEIRKQLIEFDNVMNKQREAIYGLRRSILDSDSVKDRIMEAVEETVASIVEQYLFAPADVGGEVRWDIDGLEIYLKEKFGFDSAQQRDSFKDMGREEITEILVKALKEIYENKEQEITPAQLRHIEKILLLNIIDTKWKDHLYAMDQLKEGVGLRSYAQRDPLIEYKREGFSIFQMMYVSINQELAETIFKVQPHPGAVQRRSVFGAVPRQFVHQDFSSLGASSPQSVTPPTPSTSPVPPTTKPLQNAADKVGRNDPCPCGSGKKYKKCCGGG